MEEALEEETAAEDGGMEEASEEETAAEDGGAEGTAEGAGEDPCGSGMCAAQAARRNGIRSARAKTEDRFPVIEGPFFLFKNKAG